MRCTRLAVAAALLLAGTLAAWAHAKMTASTPADGASVAAGVSQIQLQFSHPMRLTLVKVHRGEDDAAFAPTTALPKGFADSAAVDVAPLSAGAYDVSWTAVSKDGHVMKGQFSFSVKAASSAPAQ